MKTRYLQNLAAGVLAALLVSPLIAGHKNANDDKIIYLKSGDMIIPFHGEGGGEVLLNFGNAMFSEDGDLIGTRRMQLQVSSVIHIPALGIEDWLLPSQGVIDIDFFEGDPYLLKFWNAEPLEFELLDPEDPAYVPPPAHGEPPLSTGTFGIHRKTSDTMTEKYITATSVFSNGPLAGVVMTHTEHVIEPLIDPPPYASTFTGFLFVPAHIDLEVVKKCAQKGKKAKKAK